MKNKFDFGEAEIKYLLGKSHQHKLKEILLSLESIATKPAKEDSVQPVEKDKKEFQMVLNQWRHKYHIWVLWVEYIDGIYHALIEREGKSNE